MKRILILLLLIVMFIPCLANAKTCDNDKVSIKSINLENKTDNVEEKATINDKNINLNIDMDSLGDIVTYKVEIKNNSNEDYKIDNTNLSSKYIDYVIDYNDDSNIIKANSSKTVNLTLKYNKRIPNDEFTSGKYNGNDNIVINLSKNSIYDIIVNPKTGIQFAFLIITIIVILSSGTYLVIKNKKITKPMIIIMGLSIFIPISVNAICKVSININSNINIIKKNYMPCTFDGDLVPGAEFVYGDFIYHYKQKAIKISSGNHNYSLGWTDIEEDGWGVVHKDANTNIEGEIAPKMCSSINGKPIVSMSYTFYNMYNMRKIDTSYIDTSNVVHMNYTFSYFGSDTPADDNNIRSVEISGLEEWDTAKVKTMEGMFEGVGEYNNEVIITDMSYWDTSNVESFLATFEFVGEGIYENEETYRFNVKGFENWSFENAKDISYMFSYFGANFKKDVIDVSKWKTSNIELMEGVFEGFGRDAQEAKIIGLNNWDVSNVKTMSYLFLCFGTNAGTVDIGDISNWDVSNVVDMVAMFSQFADYSSVADIGDLSGWDVSNVGTMAFMFDFYGKESDTVKFFDISNWNVSNVTNMNYMFRGFGGNYDIPVDVSNWNLRNVKKMEYMFSEFGASSNKIHNVGTINVYSDSINAMFKESHNIKATINIYSNPTYGRINGQYIDTTFYEAATKEGSLITVNYSNNTTNIDDIIATKSENSNVVKGRLLD